MSTPAIEIENLTKQVRAQALLSDEAKASAVRADAAHTQASQTLAEARAAAERATQRVHALQLDVLKLVAQGLTNLDIARRLYLSKHTVHRHLANILHKLSLPSRAAAAAWGVRTGLV